MIGLPLVSADIFLVNWRDRPASPETGGDP
jgi:hypothetical protein